MEVVALLGSGHSRRTSAPSGLDEERTFPRCISDDAFAPIPAVRPGPIELVRPTLKRPSWPRQRMMGSTKEQTFAWNPVSKRQSQSDSMEAPRNMLVEPPGS